MPAYTQRVLIYQDDPNEATFSMIVGENPQFSTAADWLTWVLTVELIEEASGTYTCVLYDDEGVPLGNAEITV